ncbi:putative aryl hydrocarbon receptor nuclear translocator-like protein 1 [Apostichopus japonicus]|uniref:Putative aryl hydrocarbon receptor nuclear translocator-like protein 1 n=1 Tax=Stichopus japonicus TaxID=307972 RepID=A0A2G8L0K0_STIJA|nr:putative aryl hydrocarbon receptor nuclear translocator-like protein 1 [Apostichopus japonicus]
MNKRKHSFVLESGGEDSDNDSIVTGPSEDGSPMKKVSKQTHSAIEKKRREKMNTYIQELSGMIPTCNAMKSKLDKLTILRMAVQHMKTIRGCPSSYKEANYKPSFLSDDELKSLILEEYLIGQSLFDILHPKDMSKVKEQLSSSDLTPRERFIDTKTGLPVKSDVAPIIPQLSSGSRRSFFCRMRQHSKDSIVKTEDQSNIKKEIEICSRLHKTSTRWVTLQEAGKRLVINLATSILGYLPQELLGTSCYEYIHVGDIKQMAENHYAVLLKKEKVETKVYRFRAKNGSFLKFKSKLFCFRNPWTKEVEYIVSTNTLILDPDESNGTSNKSDKTNDGRTVVENILGDIGVQSVLQDVLGVPCNLHPAGVQIGWKIAEEVLERQWNASPSNSPGGTIDENTTGPAESTNIPSPSNGSQSQERSSTSADAINRSEHLPKEVAGSSQDGSGQRKVAHHDKPPEKEGADGWRMSRRWPSS